MTVQPFVDRNRSYKPRPWNVRRGLVAPEWRWAWEGLRLAVPMWEGGGSGQDVAFGRPSSVIGTPTWSRGKYGRQVAFDGGGVDGFDFAPYSGVTGAGTRTVFAWIRHDATSPDLADSHWFDYGLNNTGERWSCRVRGDGDLRIEVGGGGHNFSTSISDQQFHTVAFVLPRGATNVNEVVAYVDGEADTTNSTVDITLNTADADNLRVANSPLFARSWDGDMRVAYLWDQELSAQQIADLHRDPFGPFRRQTFRKISVATGPQTFTRTLDDSFTQQETLNRDFSGDRILDDQQTLAEDLTDAAIRNRNLSESFTFADTLIRDVVLTRLLSDSNPLTENLNRDFFGDRLLSDDETLTENLTRTVTQQGQATIRRISDTFTLAENLIRDQILTRLPTANFSLSENFRNLINGDVIGAAAARRFISQFSNFIEDQTLDDNVVTDFVDGIFS